MMKGSRPGFCSGILATVAVMDDSRNPVKGVTTMKIPRILTLCVAALGVALAAPALAAPALASHRVYLGVQAGYQNTNMNFSEAGAGYHFSLDGLSVHGRAGNLFAGIRVPLTPGLFVALEGNLGDSNAEHKVRSSLAVPDGDSIQGHFGLQAGKTYGVAGLLGTPLAPQTQAYVRLGRQWADYRLKAGGELTVGGAVESGGFSGEETFRGTRYGLGVQTDLSTQLALRLDYSQTRYAREQGFRPVENLAVVGVLFQF
ncbi:MAG: hypothetical protein EA349_02185 [Halomonadaceae bacterium]|nr:MAG: hypothetical protein EA349_02185 [Halomonadaceae bacterium]